MTLNVLISDLRRRGVELIADGDRLRFRAPVGALAAEERTTLSNQKMEVLAILRGETVIPIVPSGAPKGLGRQEAQGPAPGSHHTSHNSQNSQKDAAAVVTTSQGADSPGARGIEAEDLPQQDGNSDLPSRNSQKSQKGRISPGSANSANTATDLSESESRVPGATTSDEFAVTISGHRFLYFFWDGQRLTGEQLGFDTETDIPDQVVEGVEGEEVGSDSPRVPRIPTLALASASSETEHCLIHPDRLAPFILLHQDRHLVFHNAAFDVWVVARFLGEPRERKALEAWWAMVEEDRAHDTMLLDELIRLGMTDAYPRPRNLAEIAIEYASLAIDKNDPYRRRYGEIVGKDWAEVERGFFEYAIKDPIVTLKAYTVMRPKAVKIMERHGYDNSKRA
jgi:hypothetical protein